MADDQGDRPDSLSNLFDKGFEAVSQIECTTEGGNSKQYQNCVETAIKCLEQATQLVNRTGLFSSNEDLDEVATSDLKYLLLPALLGYATSRCTSKERAEAVRVAEVYYRDFLERCKQYGLRVPEDGPRSEGETDGLLCAAERRQRKIRRYLQQKEMQERSRELKGHLQKGNVDDEVAREYYTVLLRFWINSAVEELASIEEEKPILQHMAKLKGKQPTAPAPQKPLRPIILTRNELQKKVYGAGYPGLPTLTVDEFYAKRYPEREERDAPKNKSHSLQQWAADPEAAAKDQEEEEAQQEALLDADDPGTLAYLRSRDDWRDENRRGSGNRKNMG